jgi:hypothetical protein
MFLFNVQAAAFSPDGKFVAIATNNLYIYSLSHDKKEIGKSKLLVKAQLMDLHSHSEMCFY